MVAHSQAGDPGSTPGLEKSPGKGNGNPLQDSSLENSMDRGAWWATAHGEAKSRIQPRDYTSCGTPATYILLYTNYTSI